MESALSEATGVARASMAICRHLGGIMGYGGVYPPAANLPCLPIDQVPRVRVVNASEDRIGLAQVLFAQVCLQISSDRNDANSRIQLRRSTGHNLGLRPPHIFVTEEHASSQVRRRDDVEVDDQDCSNTDQDEILDDLVAGRSGANNHDSRVRQAGLRPASEFLAVMPRTGGEVDGRRNASSN